MAITVETKQVGAERKLRVRRIEIIAEHDVDLLDRTFLLEIEEVVAVDGLAVSHKHVKNVMRTLRDIMPLIDPTGVSAPQAMGMLLWDNEVQVAKVIEELNAPPVVEEPFVDPFAVVDPAEETPSVPESIPAEEHIL